MVQGAAANSGKKREAQDLSRCAAGSSHCDRYLPSLRTVVAIPLPGWRYRDNVSAIFENSGGLAHSLNIWLESS